MNFRDLKGILKTHSLRITDCRIDVLELFLRTGHALSFKNLEDRFTQYDRVTLYRTLNSFIDKGVIHKISNNSGFNSYGICHETCTADQHYHNHAHFKCDRCGNIECLPSHHVPVPEIPGYKVSESNLILNGLCTNCNPN